MGCRTVLPLARLQGLHEASWLGDVLVDGLAIGAEGECVAIEVKSPSDDIIRDVGHKFKVLVLKQYSEDRVARSRGKSRI
jgi:hypothetical protein